MDLDFGYSHEQGTCLEEIPWNRSKLQLDVDLFCAFPVAKKCRTLRCEKPYIGCDNMHRYGFLGLSLLSGCNSDSSLLSEKFTWACKHGRPYARCLLHFDPFGKLGVANSLKACKIQEQCGPQKKTAVVSMSCETEETPVKPQGDVDFIDVYFVLRLKADDVTEVNSNSIAVRSALASAMASTFQDLIMGEHMVDVGAPQVATSRRLFAGRLEFPITVTVSGKDATKFDEAMANDVGNLSVAIEDNLKDKGLANVNFDNVSPRSMAPSDMTSHEAQFEAFKSMRQVVMKHLEEAVEDLADMRDELDKEHQRRNATGPELAKAEEAHAKNRAAIAELQASHENMKKQLLDMESSSNGLLLETQEAQRVDEDAQKQLADKTAELQDAKVRLRAAELAWQASLQANDKLSVSHKNKEKELASARQSTAVKESELEAAKKRHDATRSKLEEILARNRDLKRTIADAVANQTSLEDRLEALSVVSNDVRKQLYAANSALNETRAELVETQLDLLEALRRHEATMDALADEKKAHAVTRTERDVNSIVIFVLAGVVGMLLALVLLLVWMYRRRRVMNVIADDCDGVVMGRPVAPTDGENPSAVDPSVAKKHLGGEARVATDGGATASDHRPASAGMNPALGVAVIARANTKSTE